MSSIIPKNVFHVMKSLYESGKNAEKTCNSLKTRIFFMNFQVKIVRSALFQNKTERHSNPLIAFLFGTVFASVARKKMPDKCVVFGCNNRKRAYPFIHFFLWNGEALKKKEVSRLRKINYKACWMKPTKLITLLCFLVWPRLIFKESCKRMILVFRSTQLVFL